MKKYALHRLKPAEVAAGKTSADFEPSAPAVDHSKPSDHIHCRQYKRPNWFTAQGVHLKRKLIEARGMPSLKRWRFITLTFDPDKFESPLAAFLWGRSRMRYFLKTCRDCRLWSHDAKWCWKLEFQENGWPHYHLLVGRTRKFSEHEMAKLTELWAGGRTNVEMVQEHGFAYTFKYAFKPVMQSDGDEFEDVPSYALPAWFLDYFEKGHDGSKPKSFARVRFWQTSAGFYEKPAPASRAAQNPKSSHLPRPVREIANELDNTVQVVSRERSGKYKRAAVVVLGCAFAHLVTIAGWHTIGGTACFLDTNSFVLPASAVLNKTKPNHKWQLNQLLAVNRLTLKRAATLQQRRETLRTC